jgi:hypothetical protein
MRVLIRSKETGAGFLTQHASRVVPACQQTLASLLPAIQAYQAGNPDDGERVRAMRLLSDSMGVMAEMYNALSQYAETGPRKTPTQIVAAQNERGDYVALKYKEL